MISLLIIFLGTFWEASMDIVGQKHNYENSRLKFVADYFDRKKIFFWEIRFGIILSPGLINGKITILTMVRHFLVVQLFLYL